MYIKKIKGLKYPDDYFIKFFFKHKLHLIDNLNVLEVLMVIISCCVMNMVTKYLV